MLGARAKCVVQWEQPAWRSEPFLTSGVWAWGLVVWPARRLPYSTAVSLRTVRASQRMGSTNVNYGQNQAQNHVCNRKNNSLNRIGYHFAWRCVAKLRSTCVPCLSTLKWRCVTIWRYYAILRDVTRSHAISCAVTRRVPPKGLYSLWSLPAGGPGDRWPAMGWSPSWT